MGEIKKQVSFDDYVETYEKEIQSSIGFAGQNHDFFIKVKADLIKRIADKNFSKPGNIQVLDIGCGIGLIDNQISSKFENLYGVDVEEGIIEKAKSFNPKVKYSLYKGTKLPFDDNSMDMVFTINVIHHVPPANWERFVQEMQRVTRKDGISAVFEHNPLNPLTKLAVNKCEFDRDAVLLTKRKLKSMFKNKFRLVDESYILFFPFRNNIFRSFETIFKWIPFGAQYYVCGKKI
jgi:ubiquinone/menaquinone biosynthesis C-methylase UbiE